MCRQEWPGLCCSSLGSEHLCSLRWQVGRAQSRARVCHVTFSSSVNVVDYFLRDQNWLPKIRPPSIFSPTSRTQRGKLCGAEAHGGKKGWRSLPVLVAKEADDSYLNLRHQCVTETLEEKIKKCNLKNFISEATFLFLGCAVSCADGR